MLKTIKYPDPILTTPCVLVPEDGFNKELHDLLDQMAVHMKSENGIGLAANQVGVAKRVFVMVADSGKLWEFINPEIVQKEGFQQINEGCLSAPGVFVSVPRAKDVLVKAQDRNGEVFTVLCFDLEAVCIQHELEHLRGEFFLDKTSRNQRRAALRTLGLK